MTYYLPFSPDIALGQVFGDNPGWGPNPPGGHNGDDWLTPIGTPVRSPGHGEVVFAGAFDDTYADNWGWNLNYGGLMVVLNMDGDDGPYFEFGHNSRLLVSTGDRVAPGQIFALSGNTDGGTHVITGPHSHVGCLPPNFNLGTSTYGRVNPRIYMTEYFDGEGTVEVSAETPNLQEEDNEMLVIGYDTSPGNDPTTMWIGNGIHRRHIPNPETLSALKQLSQWGVLKIFKDGEPQTVPVEALGEDVTTVTVSRILNTPVPREGVGSGIGPTTSLGAIASWSDTNIISLLNALQATATTGQTSVDEIVSGLSKELAKGIEINVSAVAKP